MCVRARLFVCAAWDSEINRLTSLIKLASKVSNKVCAVSFAHFLRSRFNQTCIIWRQSISFTVPSCMCQCLKVYLSFWIFVCFVTVGAHNANLLKLSAVKAPPPVKGALSRYSVYFCQFFCDRKWRRGDSRPRRRPMRSRPLQLHESISSAVLVRRSFKTRDLSGAFVYSATQYNVHYDNWQAGYLLSALRLERCTAAIIFPHNKMAQKITD